MFKLNACLVIQEISFQTNIALQEADNNIIVLHNILDVTHGVTDILKRVLLRT